MRPTPKLTDDTEAIQSSMTALRQIVSAHPRVLIIHHPTIHECRDRKLEAIGRRFIEEAGDLKIISMLDYLPLSSDEVELNRWYNLPFDEHPSNHGCEIYARTVQGRIQDFLTKD
jgi:hypothetical protein